MVYKTKFLKQTVEDDYQPGLTDLTITRELSDLPLSAIWIAIKGDLVAANMCIDDFCLSLTAIDVWFGGFNVLHYTHTIKALLMNCKLKQHWPYLIGHTQTIDDSAGVIFPLLFGAPYLNDKMCLPKSLDNRKTLTLSIDVATAALDDLYLDIVEVIMPDATPTGFIKQEQVGVEARGTGDKDLWLQTNWDLLKLLIHSPTVNYEHAYVNTINRAGLEIDDFPTGYKYVPFEILHGELMDELEGSGPVEDHTHLDGTAAQTGMPVALEHWIGNYAEMDFFYEKDLKWRALLAGASSAKLKYNAGVSEAWSFVQANYVPTSKVA